MKEIKVGDNLIIDKEIINLSGMVIFNKGQKVEVREVVKDEGFYSRWNGEWIPEKIIGVKLLGFYGIWFLSCFKEMINS